MRILIFALAFLALGQRLCFAQKQEFAFALPELEGRISLGVYDSGGQLVRTLAVGAEDADFKIGLNGLITTWDGRNDAGEAVASGKYTVRGYVVGSEVKTEGVAYHFNDWIEDESSPRITRIRDFQKLPGGFVLAVDVVQRVQAFKNQPVIIPRVKILRYDEVRGFVWQNDFGGKVLGSGHSFGLPLQADGPPEGPIRGGSVVTLMGPPPPASPLVAVTQDFAIASAGRLTVMKLTDGSDVHSETLSGPPVSSLDASGETVWVAARDGVSTVPIPHLSPVRKETTPSLPVKIAVQNNQLLGALETEPGFWVLADGQSTVIPAGIRATSLSFGVKGTFWATGRIADANEDVTGQFDQKGEFLRSYRSEFVPRKVDASHEVEEIAVLEDDGPAQRLRVLKLAEAVGDAPREWEIVFEKSLRECVRFGIADGALTADVGESVPPIALTLTLASAGLTTTGHKLKAEVIFDEEGLWLQTADGLRLTKLADQKDVFRVAVKPDSQGSATVFAGNGAAVAEYLVTGLGEIAEIEAGEIEIP